MMLQQKHLAKQNALITGRRQLIALRNLFTTADNQILSEVDKRTAAGLFLCVTIPILALLCYCYVYASFYKYIYLKHIGNQAANQATWLFKRQVS